MAVILSVSAHPDDETLYAGGTLAMYAEQGHDVYLLDTTRGEGGEAGDPPLATPETLGQVREQEARNAAKALGARDIFFLPFIDPHMEIDGTPLPIDVALEEFSGAIKGYIDKIHPDMVITHGSDGEYGHPQHVYTHQAVREALSQVKRYIVLMSWQAYYESERYARILNQDDPADIIRDITPWKEAKIKAALCHRTQHTMFLRNSGAPSVTAMIWMIESFHIWIGPVPEELKKIF